MPSFFRACRQKRSFSHPVSNKPSKVQQIIAELIRFNTDSSHMKWQNFLTLHRIRFFRYPCLCLKRRWQISFWNIGTSSFEWLWLCPLRHPPCPRCVRYGIPHLLHLNMGRSLVLNLHFPEHLVVDWRSLKLPEQETAINNMKEPNQQQLLLQDIWNHLN